jgi:hypothetical protein
MMNLFFICDDFNWAKRDETKESTNQTWMLDIWNFISSDDLKGMPNLQ